MIAVVMLLLAAACSRTVAPQTTQSLEDITPEEIQPGTEEPVIQESPTPFEPTETPVPAAAIVNGYAITLEEYQAEIARYRDAVGRELSPTDGSIVIDEMIREALLEQGAAEAGYGVDNGTFQAHLDQLGISEENLSEWMAAYGYTEVSFKRAFARSIAAAWMRDQIIAQVPETAEQVHARQILVNSAAEADQVTARLQAGESFDDIVGEYAPVTKGELGWFPRSYLYEPAVEEAAFLLAVDEISPVVETQLGFHIIQVIEHDPQRVLTFDALIIYQKMELERWLAEQWEKSEIVITLSE